MTALPTVVLVAPTVPEAAVDLIRSGQRVVGEQRVERDGLQAVALELDALPAALPEVAGVTVAAVPAALRTGRRLVVLDVDSTLLEDEVIEVLARHAGTERQVAAVTERAMRGELDFATSLHERVATLAGLPVGVLDDVRDEVRFTPGTLALVRALADAGCPAAAVSGGFAEVVEPIAGSLGIAHTRANRLETSGGRLTGRVRGPVVDRAAKADALVEFAQAAGVPLGRTVAVGDGANDLDMLAVAAVGIAFCAKPAVREQADVCVDVRRLDAVAPLLALPWA